MVFTSEFSKGQFTFQLLRCCFSTKAPLWYFTRTMHCLGILVTIIIVVSPGVSTEANFTLGPPGVSLNCIPISSRSSVECALRASNMDLYEGQFAYRDGQCHVCRADNINCAVLEDEYLLAGPHHFRGGFIVNLQKLVQSHTTIYCVSSDFVVATLWLKVNSCDILPTLMRVISQAFGQ